MYMKRLILFIGFFISFLFSVNCQERKDESRQKVDFIVESKSDKLSRVTGWSRIEKPTGKVWEQSELSAGYNYLPGSLHEFSFQDLKIFQLSSEGRIFFALTVKRPVFEKDEYNESSITPADKLLIQGSRVDYFFFSESGMKRLRDIVKAADGKTYPSTAVKYYKTGSETINWYDPDIAVKDKELKTIFQTGKGTIENWGNRCEGDSLFIINTQLLKGDTIVRFNLLTDISSNSEGMFNLLPLNNSYFEVTKSEFDRLFRFTPYITKDNVQKSTALIKSGNEKDKHKDYTGAISEYSKALAIDPDNADVYFRRGLSKKEIKDYRGANEDFSKAIEIEPDGSYYYARGLSEIEYGRKDNGCLDFKKAVELGYKNAKEAIKENCK